MEFSNRDKVYWEGGEHMGHPAWYYGRKLQNKGQYKRRRGELLVAKADGE